MKIIIYDEKNMIYKTGVLVGEQFTPSYITIDGINGEKRYPSRYSELKLQVDNYAESETIILDETMMKRIAMHNKEKEINELDNIIKKKTEQINSLEDILEDKTKRVDKIKEYIANIYDIDVENDEDCW